MGGELAAQVSGPEFRSPEPTQKLDLVQVSAILARDRISERLWARWPVTHSRKKKRDHLKEGGR